MELDQEKKAAGNDLDEFNAHRFLEFWQETATVIRLRELLRELGLDRKKRMSLIEYLVVKYRVTIRELIARPQGTNVELARAQQALQAAQDEINKIETRKAQLEAAANGTGIKAMQAKNELAQLLSADPTDLNRALLTAEAAVRKAQKLGGDAQGSGVCPPSGVIGSVRFFSLASDGLLPLLVPRCPLVDRPRTYRDEEVQAPEERRHRKVKGRSVRRFFLGRTFNKKFETIRTNLKVFPKQLKRWKRRSPSLACSRNGRAGAPKRRRWSSASRRLAAAPSRGSRSTTPAFCSGAAAFRAPSVRWWPGPRRRFVPSTCALHCQWRSPSSGTTAFSIFIFKFDPKLILMNLVCSCSWCTVVTRTVRRRVMQSGNAYVPLLDTTHPSRRKVRALRRLLCCLGCVVAEADLWHDERERWLKDECTKHGMPVILLDSEGSVAAELHYRKVHGSGTGGAAIDRGGTFVFGVGWIRDRILEILPRGVWAEYGCACFGTGRNLKLAYAIFTSGTTGEHWNRLQRIIIEFG